MKKLIIALSLALTLGGCATFQKVYSAATGATVSPTAVYIAANAFDGVEATATNYLTLRKCGVFPCRSAPATKIIIPAVRSGRVARNNLEQFLRDHPGQLGPQGDYDALLAATKTLQGIITQYNIGAAK